MVQDDEFVLYYQITWLIPAKHGFCISGPWNHKPKNQTGQFQDIQEIGSGQVKHQELGHTNPFTRWGGLPTVKLNLIGKIFFITIAFWIFESFNEISNQTSLVKKKFLWFLFVFNRS